MRSAKDTLLSSSDISRIENPVALRILFPQLLSGFLELFFQTLNPRTIRDHRFSPHIYLHTRTHTQVISVLAPISNFAHSGVIL